MTPFSDGPGDLAMLLLVSDNEALTGALVQMAAGLGVDAMVAGSPSEVADALARHSFALTLVDIDAADLGALAANLERAGDGPGAIVVLADGSGTDRVASAGSLLPDGLLHTPPALQEFDAAVRAALTGGRPGGRRRLHEAARVLQDTGLWRSPRMREVWRLVQEAARVDVTVLVSGETGTGKDLVARAIHHLSPRQARPFVKVNCAAVPHELLESEVFGYERGAFTGARQRRVGRFEAAGHGTVFLDEIGDLALPLQAKLFQVLRDGAFSRLGGRHTVQVNARIIAATNKDLEDACAQARFRDDLYYRLNVFPIRVPSLRERRDEIPPMANYFAEIYAQQFGREGFAIAPPVLERLRRYHFPGNVRELENLVRRMVVLNDPWLARTSFGSERGSAPGTERPDHGLVTAGSIGSLREIGRAASREAERAAILRALKQTRWNRVRAARLLRVSYRALLYKIKEAGLDLGRDQASTNGTNKKGDEAGSEFWR